MLDAFAHGNVAPAHMAHDESEASQQSGNNEDSPTDDASLPSLRPPSSAGDRQEVPLFHLQEPVIRAFVPWNNYEDMSADIAHHFAVQRAHLLDVYVVNTPLQNTMSDATPIVVHMLPDTTFANTRLVLFELEFHGHRVEMHFQCGPDVQRFVLAVPEWSQRDQILYLADAERYCQLEQNRCLVWHCGQRWPDYDTALREIVHGDLIRVALPPSDRHVCATSQLVQWTQEGLNEDGIFAKFASTRGRSLTRLAARR